MPSFPNSWYPSCLKYLHSPRLGPCKHLQLFPCLLASSQHQDQNPSVIRNCRWPQPPRPNAWSLPPHAQELRLSSPEPIPPTGPDSSGPNMPFSCHSPVQQSTMALLSHWINPVLPNTPNPQKPVLPTPAKLVSPCSCMCPSPLAGMISSLIPL